MSTEDDIPLVRLKELTRTYVTEGGVEVHALRGVSLDIHAGEFVAIVGQSGSGKSTLMNLIGCLDRPTSGDYHLAGKDITDFDADGLAWLRREVFGFVFQSYNLLPTATAEENVEVPAIYAGMPHAERQKRALALLESLGMADRTDHRPNQLSGGQQQRVSIARALMNGGQIILADEPSGALDSDSGEELMKLFEKLSDEGHTIILITHDLKVAARADRQIDLLDGRVVSDTVEFRRPASEVPQLKRGVSVKTASSIGDMMEAFRMAMRSLRANVFRTFLTLIGIMIGVMSVVIMMGIGEGTKQNIAAEINQLGANRLSVFPDVKEFPDARMPFDDVQAVEQNLSNVESVLPELSGQAVVRFRNVDYQTSIISTAGRYPRVRDWDIASGVFFTDMDSEKYNPVAVLGATAQEELFPYGGDPLGNYILINNVPFLVIGTMTRQGSGSGGGGDEDDVVFVPLKTGANRLFGENNLRAMTITVKDSSLINETEAELRELLTERHGKEDFNVLNAVQMLERLDEFMATASIVLGAIGAIALLVGGIGIMNIMLVSVTERTREIGIRMATGARQSDIMVQFLSESFVVSVLGGVVGIAVAVGLGMALTAAIPNIRVIPTGMPMLVAFACAAGTGLIFGFTPARNASRLDPVVALASD